VPQEQLQKTVLGMAVHRHMEMLLAPVALQQHLPLVVAVVATGVVGPQANLHSGLVLQQADTQAAAVVQVSPLKRHFLCQIAGQLQE
jgi:hypothetical protein